ncbi:MAG: T9SS type A sorting domain-containing protein, partial [Bacteroidetes bacterium]|nr:T9SS type A sorting domain-containing protein [Bacteroidota bacterium]
TDILQSVLLASVYADPSTGVVQLEYRLPRPGPVTVSIMNVLGQVVQRHRIEIQPAGLYVLPLSFEGMSGGTYFVQVSSNQSATTVRTILIR